MANAEVDMADEMKATAREINRLATGAEMREMARPFFREFGIATWAALVGAAAAVLGCWWAWQAKVALMAGAFYFLSVGVVYVAGVASAVIAWWALKLIAFVARRGR